MLKLLQGGLNGYPVKARKPQKAKKTVKKPKGLKQGDARPTLENEGVAPKG